MTIFINERGHIIYRYEQQESLADLAITKSGPYRLLQNGTSNGLFSSLGQKLFGRDRHNPSLKVNGIFVGDYGDVSLTGKVSNHRERKDGEIVRTSPLQRIVFKSGAEMQITTFHLDDLYHKGGDINDRLNDPNLTAIFNISKEYPKAVVNNQRELVVRINSTNSVYTLATTAETEVPDGVDNWFRPTAIFVANNQIRIQGENVPGKNNQAGKRGTIHFAVKSFEMENGDVYHPVLNLTEELSMHPVKWAPFARKTREPLPRDPK